MKFFKAFVADESTVIMGAKRDKKTGKRVPNDKEPVWFCIENSTILQKNAEGTWDIYSLHNFPFGSNARVRLFDKVSGNKTFNQIVGSKDAV